MYRPLNNLICVSGQKSFFHSATKSHFVVNRFNASSLIELPHHIQFKFNQVRLCTQQIQLQDREKHVVELLTKGDLQNAKRLIEKEEANGDPYSHFVYTKQLSSQIIEAKLKDPFPLIDNFFSHAELANHIPNKYTFNTIFSAILRSGQLKTVLDFFTKYGNNPAWEKSFITYQTLFLTQLKLGNINAAIESYNKMISFQHRQIPNKSFVYFMRSLQASKKYSEIIEFFERDRNRVVDIDVDSYAAYMSALANKKLGEKVVACLEEVKTKFPTKVSEIYNNALVYFVSIKDVQTSIKILKELMSSATVPVTAWNRGMELLVDEGMYKEGVELFNDLKSKKFVPNIVTWNHLLSCMLGLQRYADCIGVVERMKEQKIELNSYTYDRLIDTFSKLGYLSTAEKYLDITAQTHKPKINQYNTLLFALSSAKNVEGCQRLMKKMREAGLSPDKVSYANLLRALYHAKEYTKLLSTLEEAIQLNIPLEVVTMRMALRQTFDLKLTATTTKLTKDLLYGFDSRDNRSILTQGDLELVKQWIEEIKKINN